MGQNDASTILDAIHKNLQKKFISNKQDEKDAMYLEEFFNYIVYGREELTSSQYNPFQKLVNESIKNELRQSSYVQNLYQNVSDETSRYDIGRYGEEGLTYLVTAAIALLTRNNELDTSLEKEITQLLNNKTIDDAIVGDQLATIIPKTILQKICSQAVAEGQRTKAFKALYKKYGVFALRQGKIDSDMARLSLDIQTNSFARRLAKMSMTIKNYSSNMIHLEKVSVLKAYQAYHLAVTRARDIKKINKNYDKIIAKIIKARQDKEKDFAHIGHFVNMYALTGMGQTYIDTAHIEQTMNASMVQAQLGARFLMVNQRSSKRIYVIPTASIAQFAFQEDSVFYYGEKGASSKLVMNSNNKNIDVSLNIYQAHKQIFPKSIKLTN